MNTESNQVVKNTSIVDGALARINEMQTTGNLQLPANYNAENAMRSAWLLIQQTKNLENKPALEICTQASVANALLDMVLQGLSPVKKQCYFIVYGSTLTMQRSYFGTIAISKRVAGVKEAIGIPIYEKDVFKYTIDIRSGVKTVTQHEQEFENIDVAKLKGAYAVITYEDGHVEYDIMTMQQIRASWEMGKAKGNSPAHKNFPDQMACRTVISRALKIPVNSSNDEDLFTEVEENTFSKQVTEDVKHTIATEANGANGEEAIGFEEEDEQVELVEMVDEPAPVIETKITPDPVKQNGKATAVKIPF
jgi:recombination protein RecT